MPMILEFRLESSLSDTLCQSDVYTMVEYGLFILFNKMLKLNGMHKSLNKKITLRVCLCVFPWMAGMAGTGHVMAAGEASNPMAAVQFQDVRYRHVFLADSRVADTLETEGAYLINPHFKLTNELRVIDTDRSGNSQTDLQEFKLGGTYLRDGEMFNRHVNYAFAVEWIKNLGDVRDGTGSGSDKISPLAGISWAATEKDTFAALLQYAYSYEEDRYAASVRQTQPRFIYIREIPENQGWFKADLKGVIDHEDNENLQATLELQFGLMLNRRMGIYGEALLGDDFLDSDLYDTGFAIAVRFRY